VAIRTESQKSPDKGALVECYRYLETEMTPAFAAMSFQSRIYDNPFEGYGPVLIAARIEDRKLATVLGYGHGDVVLGVEERWTKGMGPWRTARDGERLYGRGRADNKGQHTLNMAALRSVLEARRPARLQRQVHDRDDGGDGLEGLAGDRRTLQIRFLRRCAESPPMARACARTARGWRSAAAAPSISI
jgi:acetylornithine deacetylase/succinyl-diaminopimelate desuccinylase-like protein